MLRTRVLSSAKLLWISRQENILYNGATQTSTHGTLSNTTTAQAVRSVYLSVPTCGIATHPVKPNIIVDFFRNIKIIDLGKYRRKVNGYRLYEDIVDKINYTIFFSDFKMPDTFNSWFIITELHVWMLMVRCMAEGSNGQDLRNHIVEAMWADINVRKTKLERANPTALRRQVDLLSQQFNAAIIGYDEGLMSNDKILAGALWRRFLQCEGNNPEAVEKLVAYVRKQVNELDDIPSADIMTMKTTRWLDYKNI